LRILTPLKFTMRDDRATSGYELHNVAATGKSGWTDKTAGPAEKREVKTEAEASVCEVGTMAPRTPKDPETKPAKPKPVAKAKVKPATTAAGAKPAKPALKVVEKSSPPTDATAGAMRLKDLIDSVAATTGGKKPEVKKTIEATLAAIGTALAASTSLVLPPLGKLRVAKATGAALTLKLRLADKSKAAGIALADDKEDE
jgi:hypothetical protein